MSQYTLYVVLTRRDDARETIAVNIGRVRAVCLRHTSFASVGGPLSVYLSYLYS